MFGIILKALSLLFIICIGIFLRRKKIVDEQAGQTIKKILLNVTLPAAIVTNFATIDTMSIALVSLVGLGLIFNLLMIGVGILVSMRGPRSDRALYVVSLPAVNIGAFGLPFVQEFLPAISTVSACMFDVGNSIMCTGVTYAIASAYAGSGDGHFSIVNFLKKLFSSVTFDTYLLMFLLKLFRVPTLAVVTDFIRPIASANSFIAMLMIGLLFHFEPRARDIRALCKILGLRLIFAACMSWFFYTVLPFDLEIRQALAILSFGPMSTVASAFVADCNGDEGLASCASSLSIVVSLFAMSAVTIALGIL